MVKKRGSNLALGAAIAAGVGYVTGILTAPKSGKQTRQDLQKTAYKAKQDAEAKLKELHSDLTKLITKGSTEAKNMRGKAKTEMDQALTKARAAKDKSRELLSAIHEGEADNKDLQKAIDEAKKATKHLKTFVTNEPKNKTKAKK